MLERPEGQCWHGIPDNYTLADGPRYTSVSAIARSTGWAELDDLFKIYPGQFTAVHGPTNHGKSTFLFNLVVQQFAEHGTKSWLFVPENERQLHHRLSLIWGDRQNWDSFANLGVVYGSAIPRQDKSRRDLQWILGSCEACIDEGHVGMAVLDPWNEIEFSRPRDISQQEWIGLCLKAITEFCRRTNVTLFLSAHPTKSGVQDGKVPGAYDMADSAHFGNKPDNILCVFREKDGNSTFIESQKVREIGAGRRGKCYFTVDPDTGVFTPQYGGVSL